MVSFSVPLCRLILQKGWTVVVDSTALVDPDISFLPSSPSVGLFKSNPANSANE